MLLSLICMVLCLAPHCFAVPLSSWVYESIDAAPAGSQQSSVRLTSGNFRSRQSQKVNHYFSDELSTRIHSFTTSDLYREGFIQNCDAILANNYSAINSSYKNPTDEQRLTCVLLNNYSPAIRPVATKNEILVVNFSLAINQIFDLDDHDQVLTINVWFEQSWSDPAFQWEPSEFGNLTTINLPASYVFIPDIELYNTAADYTKRRAQFRTMVYNDGKIFYGIPAKLVSTCHINPTYFPFDSQVCHLKFGSWTFSGYEIDLQPSRENVDLSRLESNGKWDLVDVIQKRHSIMYSCCPDPFVDISYYIILKRRAMYYIVSVYFFTGMLVVMTVAVYQLPIYANEKCSLGTAVLFSISVFMLSITEKLPESSEYIPVINVYLFIVMGMSAGSLALTVGVHAVHYQHTRLLKNSKHPQIRRVPKFLRWLIHFYQNHCGQEVAYAVKQNRKKYEKKKRCAKKLRNYQKSIFQQINRLLFANSRKQLRGHHYESIVDENNKEFAVVIQRRGKGGNKRMKMLPDDSGLTTSLLCGIEDIYFAIERLANSYDAQVERAFSLIEWHELAAIFDIILFWCFVLLTISSFSFVFGVASLKAPTSQEILQSDLEHRHE